ncbi:glycosyl transferase [Spirochaetia bacterium]|nr:glycosyl transferase [Spirochaetia bacterium]
MGGGAEKVLAMLLGGISEYYDIDVLERTEDTTHLYQIPRINKLCSISYTPYAAARYNKSLFLQRIWLTLLKVLIMFAPGVIYHKYIKKQYDYEISFNYLFTSFLVAYSKNKKSKKIMWNHGSIENLEYRQYRGIKRLIYLICFKWQQKAFRKADVIIAISNKTKKSIESLYPEYKEKNVILHNGCDIDNIKNKSLDTVQDVMVVNGKKNIILGIGRLEKLKNFELLIRAVSVVIHTGIECFLVLIGDGELRKELETIVRKECISEYVFFTGFQANPYPYFRFSKIVCLSSFAEGFPTIILEALCFGKPFVTTPVAGASEELADNQNCGLVSDWNVNEYAGCIKKFLTDDALYEKMSKNCLEKVKEFSVERQVSNFNRLLQSLDQK